MRLACPDCGAEFSINKRRVRRARPTAVPCDHCSARLAVSKLKSGDLTVTVERTGGKTDKVDEAAIAAASVADKATRPEAKSAATTPRPEVAQKAPVESVDDLPESAFHRGDSGGIPPQIPKGSPFYVPPAVSGPVIVGDVEDSAEVAVALVAEKTDPGVANAFDQTDPGFDTHQVEATSDGIVSPSAMVQAPSAARVTAPVAPTARSSRTNRRVTSRRPSRASRAAKEKALKTDRNPAVPTDVPLTLAMPEPLKRQKPSRDMDKMLREYSVMFRLDNRSKRRRNTLLTGGVLVVAAVAIVAVALSSDGPDPVVLQDAATAAEAFDMRRSTSVRYTLRNHADAHPDLAGRTTRISALAAAMATKLAQKITARLQAEKAEKTAAEAAAAAPEPATAPAPPNEPVVEKPKRKRKRRRRKRRRRRKLPSFD